jgi:hypothetical protein
MAESSWVGMVRLKSSNNNRRYPKGCVSGWRRSVVYLDGPERVCLGLALPKGFYGNARTATSSTIDQLPNEFTRNVTYRPSIGCVAFTVTVAV